MGCEHLKNGLCLISTNIAGIDVPAAEDACLACQQQKNPMAVNHVTSSKAIYTLHLAGKTAPKELFTKVKGNAIVAQGPGTELEKLISWFKRKSKSCNCSSRIQKMNRWGPDECEKRMPTILRWLRHSAAKQKLPFVEQVAERLVKRAIKNARRIMDGCSDDCTPSELHTQ